MIIYSNIISYNQFNFNLISLLKEYKTAKSFDRKEIQFLVIKLFEKWNLSYLVFYFHFWVNPLVKLNYPGVLRPVLHTYTQWKLPGNIPDGQLWPNAYAFEITCADKYGFNSTMWYNSNYAYYLLKSWSEANNNILDWFYDSFS